MHPGCIPRNMGGRSDEGAITESGRTGGWGTVTYWNAFVAVLELHGVGTFFDERLDNTNKFPIAAAAWPAGERPATNFRTSSSTSSRVVRSLPRVQMCGNFSAS